MLETTMRDHVTLHQTEVIDRRAERLPLQLKTPRAFSVFYLGKRGKKMMVHTRLPKRWKLPQLLPKDLSDQLAWVFGEPMVVIPTLTSPARHWATIETAVL
jgi:hypothetical protein